MGEVITVFNWGGGGGGGERGRWGEIYITGQNHHQPNSNRSSPPLQRFHLWSSDNHSQQEVVVAQVRQRGYNLTVLEK